MLFNSFEFFVFFAFVYGAYLLLPFRYQNTLLLLAGYTFYGWWDVRFLFLIAFSTTVDFWIGLMLEDGRLHWRQRVATSVFITAAAFAFLFVDWHILLSADFSKIGGAFKFDDPVALSALAASLVFVVVTNYFHDRIGNLSAERRRQLMLFFTVFVNLSFLGVFKYFNFFIDSAEAMIRAMGWNSSMFHLHILLPVGISFYTFQSLSYTIDIARQKVKPARRLQDFALFVAYFPPMVAGPIERARHLLPQLLRPRHITLRQVSYGLLLIVFGLFKKVGIADGLAVPVNIIFDSTGAVPFSDVCIATILFAFQIFCDFSGYTDIARGVSKLMGIELTLNFNLPYFSKNPSDFWRRWHISLSSWLRDYLYISLGGNRSSATRTYLNLMLTMVLGGLWHGAAWNFVLWGGYQGALLCAHRFITIGKEQTEGVKRSLSNRIVEFLKMVFFFAFICYGWLLFRANSFHQIVSFTQTLLGFGVAGAPSILQRPPLGAMLGLLLLAILQTAEYLDGRTDVVRYWRKPIQGLVLAFMFLILVMGASNVPVQFIYFQF